MRESHRPILAQVSFPFPSLLYLLSAPADILHDMGARKFTAADLKSARDHLWQHGYAILPEVLSPAAVAETNRELDDLFAREGDTPFEPHFGETTIDDQPADMKEVEHFLTLSYAVSQAEVARLVRRIRHTRNEELDTPWPVPVSEVNKLFLHLPTLFDDDRSQRIWNLPSKLDVAAQLIEHPTILQLTRIVLGADCVLSDCSATSIGPHTDGGAWHVDVPLGQLDEPLPDFALTTQNVWMLDDFTADNGATRVVPGSHLSRSKPSWSEGELAGEITLQAPAGSVAMWLSSTWHRSGPNSTERPRRAILCYYCRSWIKSFNDFQAGIPRDKAQRFSPTLRYLLGYSAHGPVRG